VTVDAPSSTSKGAGFRAVLWTLRLAVAAMLLVGGYVAYQRLHRTPEQVELSFYVETEVPSLAGSDGDILRRLQPLTAGRGLDAAAARRLLVDEVIPRLVALRKRAASIIARTDDVKRLVADYLAWIDKLIDACRTSVRAIDDPDAAPEAALAQVRQRFAEADAAARAWSDHVREACVKHRLAPPQSR